MGGNEPLSFFNTYLYVRKCKSGSDLSDTDVSGVINHPVRINPTKPTHLFREWVVY